MGKSARAAERSSNAESENVRARATRERLVGAVVELANTGNGSELTPTAICRAAGVSRSSFYAHFDDVGAAVAAAMREALGRIEDGALAISWASQGERDGDAVRSSLTALFEQLDQFVGLFHGLTDLSAGGTSALVTEAFQGSVEATIRRRRPELPEGRVRIGAGFVTGGILTAYAQSSAPERRSELIDELVEWIPSWLIHADPEPMNHTHDNSRSE